MKAKATVSPESIKAGITRVKPLIAKLPKDLRLTDKAMSDTAINRAVVTMPKNVSEEGPALVLAGDLEIGGWFEIGCLCVVLGDLVVGGAISAMHNQTALVVGGKIKARGIVWSQSTQVAAAGGIEAEVIFVETSSTVRAGGPIDAELVILEDRKFSKIEGKLRAKDKVVLTYPEGNTSGLDQLRELLDPKAFRVLPGGEGIFDYTNLLGALQRGKPWRKAGGKSSRKSVAVKAPTAKSTSQKPPSKQAAPAAAKKSARAARRFEFAFGTSRKFWQVEVKGNSLVTTYGRLGATGQSTTKSFASAQVAQAEADKLVREKTRKGYREK